jgi:hypothetical protein
MDAEKIFAKVKHHLMAIGTPVALKLRDAFIKRIKVRRNHTLICTSFVSQITGILKKIVLMYLLLKKILSS